MLLQNLDVCQRLKIKCFGVLLSFNKNRITLLGFVFFHCKRSVFPLISVRFCTSFIALFRGFFPLFN